MSNNTDKNPAQSRVAVVADQSDDGSFELRVERPSDTNTVVDEVASGSSSGAMSNLKAEPTPEPRKSRAVAITAGSAAAVGIAAAFALSVSGGPAEPEPPVVEPEPADTFRAFTIQTPEANLPRSILSADVGADTVAEVEPDPSLTQSPQSPPPAEPATRPERIPAPNPAAVPQLDDDLAQRLQNVRVAASPGTVVLVGDDDDYDDYDDYDEYDDDGEYDDEEFE